MATRFSERQGFKPVRSMLQVESLDDTTRIELWNTTSRVLEILDSRADYPSQSRMLTEMWETLWCRPVDELPDWRDEFLSIVKTTIFAAPWFEVCDLVEFIAEAADREDRGEAVKSAYDSVLKRNLAPCRFVDGTLTPIIGEHEIVTIETALTASEDLDGVQHHLKRALALLADREKPDYPNSVKESISAVESACLVVTAESSISAALRVLAESDPGLHPALSRAWSALYGFTSDEDGVRHGSVAAPIVDQALALYFLGSCSAFVTYLLATQRT